MSSDTWRQIANDVLAGHLGYVEDNLPILYGISNAEHTEFLGTFRPDNLDPVEEEMLGYWGYPEEPSHQEQRAIACLLFADMKE